MRCTHCNGDNPEGATRCQKCNRPLERIAPSHSSSPSASIPSPAADWESRPTVCYESDSEPSVIEKRQCPGCSYPVMPGDVTCPSCGCALDSSLNSQPNQTRQHTELDASSTAGPVGNDSRHKCTVRDANFSQSPGRATVRDMSFTASNHQNESPQMSRGTLLDVSYSPEQHSIPVLAPINNPSIQNDAPVLHRGDVVIIDEHPYLIF